VHGRAWAGGVLQRGLGVLQTQGVRSAVNGPATEEWPIVYKRAGTNRTLRCWRVHSWMLRMTRENESPSKRLQPQSLDRSAC
jgi:hypothetical protein